MASVGCSAVAVGGCEFVVLGSGAVARVEGVANHVGTLISVPAGIVAILLGIICSVTAA